MQLQLSICLSIYLFIYLSFCLSICLSIYLSASLKTKPFCETSSIFELHNIKNETICETSSIFEVDNIKNETILRDFFQKWKVECRADGLAPIVFRFSTPPVYKVLRLPRKSDARSCEVLHLSCKIIFPKLKI